MNDEEKYLTLSEEDRAALKYAHFLKSYDDDLDEKDAGGRGARLERSEREEAIVLGVKRERQFYLTFMTYIAVIVFLLIINLLTSPGYLWVVWPALGMGIGIAMQAVRVFGGGVQFGDEWERRKIEERLRKL